MLEQKTIHDKIKKFCYILISFTDRAVMPINLLELAGFGHNYGTYRSVVLDVLSEDEL